MKWQPFLPSTKRPNIVVLIADDLGYGDLGVYGSTSIPTPNIDHVARNGVRFLDMHASAAVCTPSRYGLLTGRYCWRTWLSRSVLGGFGAPLIAPGEATLPALLRDQGYATAAVGKWHLGLDWYTRGGIPLERIQRDGWDLDGFDVDYSRPFGRGPVDCGFEYWYGMAGSLDMPPYCLIENRLPVMTPSREKDPYRPQQRRGLMAEEWNDEEIDARFRDKACDLIQQFHRQRPEDPFFLYVASSAPHRPCLPPGSAIGRSNAGMRGDMVTVFDDMAGAIRDALERAGELENTLFVVTSDHGARLTDIDGERYGHNANGELRGEKGDIYEGGHRVPFVASWPRAMKAGTVCAEPLMLPDLAATCVDLAAGTDTPGKLNDGRSFVSLLAGENSGQPIHDAMIHHSMDGLFAVRSGPWKLVNGLGSGGFSQPTREEPQPGEAPGQLFNLDDDMSEQNNLYQIRPDIVERLRSALPAQAN